MAEYLGEAVVAVDVRPVRAAYLVRAGSVTDFKQAVYRAVDRWGGIHESIVPVSKTGRIRPGYVSLLTRRAEPDVIFDIGGLSTEVIAETQAKLNRLVYPVGLTTHWDRFHPLLAHSAESISSLHLVQAAAPALIDRAGPGFIQDAAELREWRQFGATVDETTDRVSLAIAQLRDQTLVAATAHQCREVQIESPFSMTHVWLAPPNSLKDALEFWNLRALAPRDLERDYWVLTSPEVFLDDRFKEALMTALRNRPQRSDPTFMLSSLSLSKSNLQRVVKAAGFELQQGGGMKVSYQVGETDPPGDDGRVTVRIGVVPFSGRTLYGIRTSPSVQLFSEGTRLRTPSPFRAHSRYGHGPVRIRLSGAAQLEAPASVSVAHLFHDQAEWVRGNLELGMMHDDTIDIPLRIPSRRAILDAHLADRSLRFTLSRPGKYAQAIIGRVSSPDLFLDPNVEKVIAALTSTTPAKQLAGLARSNALSEETVAAILAGLDARPPRVERSALDIRHLTRLKLEEVLTMLDELAFSGLVERGLVNDCGECGVRSFQPFPEVNSKATCPACGSRGRFAGDKTGPMVHYRLNALLDRASAQGALVHLYAVAALLREDRTMLVLPGADITRPDGTAAEIDILGLAGAAVLGGEAKRSASWFTDPQVDRDIALTAELGGTRHLMVCLEPLPSSAIDSAKELAEAANVDLAVLCPPGNQLRSVHRKT